MRGKSAHYTVIGVALLMLIVATIDMSLHKWSVWAAPLPVNELLITANDDNKTVNVGDTTQYSYLLSNSTTDEMVTSITVASSPSDWQTRLVDSSQASLTVAAGSEETIIVEVRVPTYENGTNNDDTALTTITVTDADGTAFAASNTTTAETTKGFDFLLPTTKNVGPSTTATFLIEATNTGSTQQDLSLTITSEGDYTTDIEKTDGSLVSQISVNAVAPNVKQVFKIVMQIPAFASGGDSNTAQAILSYAGREETVDLVATIDQALAPTDTPTTVPTETAVPTATFEPVATADGSIYADDREPNNTRAQTAFFNAQLSEICNQTFWPSSDIDHYAFIATAGQQYTIKSRESASGSGTGLDPVMKLINPQGNIIAENDAYLKDGIQYIFPTIVFVPKQSGTFIVALKNKGIVDPTNLTYCIDVEESTYQSPTPTPTTTPTATPTATPLPDGDSCEPNETLDQACLIALNTNNGQNFVPGYGGGIDRDYYRIWVKPNVRHNCRVTINDGSIADTTMTIFDQSGGWLGFNDDRAPDDNGSEVYFAPTYQGYAYILVEPLNAPVGLKRSDSIENLYAYTLRCESTPPTSTPQPTSTATKTATPEPSSTPQPTSTGTPITPSAFTNDDCEPNENTGMSCLLAPGEAVGANFRPPYGSGNDRDYYRLYVKPGIEYTCETRNLSRLTDTKLTIFNLNGQKMGFNDDRETGDFSSEVTVNPGYQGNLFILVESSIYIKPNDDNNFGYEVLCQSAVLPTPVPSSTPQPTSTNTPWPTRTPWPTNTPWTPSTPIKKITDTPSPKATDRPTQSAKATKVPPTAQPTQNKNNKPTATKQPTARPRSTTRPANGSGGQPSTTQPTARPRSTTRPTVRPTNVRPVTATAKLPIATSQPTATPFVLPTNTAVPTINIVPIKTPTPVVLAVPEVELEVSVYYDSNNSYSAEINEGVMDVAVSVYDNTSGELLGFGYTNEAGDVFFGGNPPLETNGSVRLSIPYLNYEQIIPAGITQIDIRIPPQQIPGQVP